jgi:hypothetical protein
MSQVTVVHPAWQSGVEVGVAGLALCLGLVAYLSLVAINPPRRRLLSFAAWSLAWLAAAAPVALFDRQAGWLFMAALAGVATWGAIELRNWSRHWTYVEWPARRRREEAFRRYKPKAF